MSIMNDRIDAGTPLYDQLKSAADPSAMAATWSTRDLMNVGAVAQSNHDQEIYRIVYDVLHDPAAQHDIVANATDDEFFNSLDPRDKLWAMGRCVDCADMPDRCQVCERAAMNTARLHLYDDGTRGLEVNGQNITEGLKGYDLTMSNGILDGTEPLRITVTFTATVESR